MTRLIMIGFTIRREAFEAPKRWLLLVLADDNGLFLSIVFATQQVMVSVQNLVQPAEAALCVVFGVADVGPPIHFM